MTFKTLLPFGGSYEPPVTPAIDRYHHGHYDYDRDWHGHSSKGGGGHGSGAALSALTLLAFLFLLNVMQQSLVDNNSTVTTTAATIFLRKVDQPISLKSRAYDDDYFAEETTEDPKKGESYVKLTDSLN